MEEYWQEEARCLLLISAEEVATKVVSGNLEEWAMEARAKLEGRHLTLVIWDYQQYFRAEENARERVKKAQVRGAAPAARDMALMSGRASKYNMEEALVKLSIARVADYFTCSPEPGGGWQQCAGIVFHHTRAVAEAPDKIKKGLSGSGGFDFWAKGLSGSADTKNLTEYWKEVLQQVSSGAGLEKVSAVATTYPSPSNLVRAFQAGGPDLLKDLEVRRRDNVLGGTKKVGPDISRKLHTLLTCRDPDTVL